MRLVLWNEAAKVGCLKTHDHVFHDQGANMLHISTAGHARANFNAALNVTASMQKALLCGVSVLACGVVL
ncbi:MAG: hypothetical protein B7Z77_06000, partial [Acidocella sp. 20-58-15]